MNKLYLIAAWQVCFFTCFLKTYSQSNSIAQQHLFEKGISETEQFKYDSALTSFNACINICRNRKDLKTLEDALNKRAYVLIRKGEYKSAKNDYLEILQNANAENNKTKIAGLYVLLSQLSRDNNQYDSCLFYGEKSLALSTLLNDSALLGKSYNAIGLAYYSKSMYNKANIIWLKALKISENIKDSLNAAEVLGYLGILNSDLKNQTESLDLIRRALNKFIHNNQFIEEGNAYMRLGVTYKRLKQDDSTLFYYRKAIVFADSINETRLLARSYHNISNLFVYHNNLDSALFYNRLSIDLYKHMNVATGIISSQNSLGQLYRTMGEQTKDKSYFSKAITLFEEDLSRAREINFNDFISRCYEELAYCNEGLGNYNKAYQYLVKYNLLEDSIRGEGLTNQVADLQAKYESEKKELEIEKLNSEKLLDTEKISRQKTLNNSLLVIAGLIIASAFIIFRNVQNKRLSEKQIALLEKQNAIETMRSKIASDVHDDIGATLTRMGLYSQQLLQLKSFSEKEKQMLEKISIQSKEVITGMKEIIWASNPANDNLKSMLGFMRQYIDRFFDGTDIRPVVNFPYVIVEISLHPEVRRNLFLILKESLNNAIKYSDSDKIDIEFTNDNENYKFNIKDYGNGINDKNKNDFSNGLKNMQMRAKQIQSAFKIISVPGNGVQIYIEGKLY